MLEVVTEASSTGDRSVAEGTIAEPRSDRLDLQQRNAGSAPVTMPIRIGM
jgi:hypothetical protein